jgi:hypothetical protein
MNMAAARKLYSYCRWEMIKAKEEEKKNEKEN